MVEPVTAASVFAVISYVSTSIAFFNNINNLSKQQFHDADEAIRQVHALVAYQPDKSLRERIEVKYRYLHTILAHWNEIDNYTLRKFADEILYGDGSINNAIWRFHISVYAPEGYFALMTNNALDERYWGKGPLGIRGTDSAAVNEKFHKFFPTFLDVEMQATSLIYFGFFVERLFDCKLGFISSEILT